MDRFAVEKILLNPFSSEARELARSAPRLDELGEEYVRACRERVEWLSTPRTTADGVPIESERAPPESLVNPPDPAFDISVLYLLMQACASTFPPSSFEARMVVEANREIYRRRLKAHYMRIREGISELLPDMKVERVVEGEIPRSDMYKIMAQRKFLSPRTRTGTYSFTNEIRFKTRWTSLLWLPSDLVEFYIRRGWAYLSAEDMLDLASYRIGQMVQSYISEVAARMKKVGIRPHRVFRRVASMLSEIAEQTHRELVSQGGRLVEECFPPCIKIAEKGVDAGSRNYAITVLLTSFLSHARISPFAGDAKISDFIDDISIVTEEILPRIYEAGSRCKPPLFEDQPMEKANVLYHLGFGLVQTPRLVDSGNSTWYITPNCEKIQREVPSLCQPDELCERIKNPMQYYVIKLRRMRQGGSPRRDRAEETAGPR